MWSARFRYSPLSNGSTLEYNRPNIHLFISIAGSLLLAIISFAAGRYWNISSNIITSVIPLDSEKHTLIYNRTFAENSAASDAAWKTLFPHQNGYFTHPVIAPHRSTFSVFHLLHCLNGIRQGYWAIFDLATTGEILNETDLPLMISPPHIRHCIDLLRQNLMCNADLTIEAKDKVLNGVHGFGTEHTCIDWDSLMEWTTEWEKFSETV